MASGLFKCLSSTEVFQGVEGMVFQVSSKTLRLQDKKVQMEEIQALIKALDYAFRNTT